MRHDKTALTSEIGPNAMCSLHRSANSLPHRNAGWIEAIQTEDIDTQILRCDALAMKWINAACLAEKMTRSHGVKAVFSQRVVTGQQPELTFVNLHHQRILAPTDRTIAGGQLGKISLNLEGDGTAMAAAAILLCGSMWHLVE